MRSLGLLKSATRELMVIILSPVRGVKAVITDPTDHFRPGGYLSGRLSLLQGLTNGPLAGEWRDTGPTSEPMTGTHQLTARD
jgi:hypothetical protein